MYYRMYKETGYTPLHPGYQSAMYCILINTQVAYRIQGGSGESSDESRIFAKMTFLSCSIVSAAACAAPRAARGFAIGAPTPTLKASRGWSLRSQIQMSYVRNAIRPQGVAL